MYYSLSSASMSLPSAKKGYMGGAVKPSRGRGIVERYIATLKASEGGYIKLAQPIDIGANDDFELVFSYFTSDEFPVSDNRFIAGGDGGSGTPDTFAIYLDKSTGSVSLQIPLANSTSTYVSLTPAAVSNIFNTVTLKRVANNWTLTCGNVTKTVTLAQTLALKITNLAKWGGVAKFNGLYLAFKLWTGGDSSIGQKVIDYDFNVAKGTTIIPNLAQPLGSELWDDSAVNTVGAVSQIQGGWHVDLPDNANAELTIVGALEVGKTYLVSIEIYDRVTGGVAWNSSGWTPFPQQMGVHELLVKATSTSIKITRSGTGTNLKLRNITVKEAPNWAEYINVTDDNKELYEWEPEYNAWKPITATLSGGFNWTGLEPDYYVQGFTTLDEGLYEVTLDLTGGLSGKLKTQTAIAGTMPFLAHGLKYVSVYRNGGNVAMGQTGNLDKYVGQNVTEYRKLLEVAQ